MKKLKRILLVALLTVATLSLAACPTDGAPNFDNQTTGAST